MSSPTVPPEMQDTEGFETDYGELAIGLHLRLVYDGFGMEATVHCAINELPEIILQLKSMGVKGANTPLLWPEDKPPAHQPVSTPPQPYQVPPPQQPPQQQATGWDAQGNTTYAPAPSPLPQAPRPVPTRFDPDGTPHCPYHGERMAVSKFGGWYCQKQGGPAPNQRGYCSYQYKGA